MSASATTTTKPQPLYRRVVRRMLHQLVDDTMTRTYRINPAALPFYAHMFENLTDEQFLQLVNISVGIFIGHNPFEMRHLYRMIKERGPLTGYHIKAILVDASQQISNKARNLFLLDHNVPAYNLLYQMRLTSNINLHLGELLHVMSQHEILVHEDAPGLEPRNAAPPPSNSGVAESASVIETGAKTIVSTMQSWSGTILCIIAMFLLYTVIYLLTGSPPPPLFV